MTVWIGLLLGTTAWAVVGGPDPAVPPSGPSAGEAVLAAPGDGQSAPSPLETQQLDEYVLMITGNNEPGVRLIGARRLLEAGSDEASGRLSNVLLDHPGDLAAQTAVCRAIADFDSPMANLAEPLLVLLGDPRPGLDQAVVQALRRFDNGRVVDRLGYLAADLAAESGRREAAIGALGEMGENIQAVAALIALVQDQDSRVGLAALEALEQATGAGHADAAAALAWWADHQSKSPVEWMRAVNEHRAARIQDLQNQARSLIARLVALNRESYLATPDADRPAKLLVFLSDDLAEIRALGLDLINAMITDRKEVSPEIKARLVEMISGPDPAVRVKVAVMVGDLRLTSALPQLVDALSGERDHRARAAQVNAIGRLDGATAMPALLAGLDDQSTVVVGEAAIALAAIGRRAQEQPQTVATVSAALIQRFAEIPLLEEDLREVFLSAMALIGAESFRTIFLAELGSDRGVAIRRAAIAALGAYADSAAAVVLRPLIAAPEIEIRLAAVQAMGKCGRSTEDLEALESRLDSASEPDQAIRDRAWEAYAQIAQRLAPRQMVSVADRFAKPDDKVAQRRRLELLKSLTSAAQKFKQLTTEEQIGVYERTADAQSVLGDFSAAAANLEQAVALVQDLSGAQFASLAARLVAALLRGDDDQKAVRRFDELTRAAAQGDEEFNSQPLAAAVLNEVRTRIEAAANPADYARAMQLVDSVSGTSPGNDPQLHPQLDAARAELVAKRDSAIDVLLGTIASDPEAEVALIAYGKDLVLPRLHARLTALSTTSAPANGLEDELVKLATKLAGQWPGYQIGCPPEERAAALQALRTFWDPATQQTLPPTATAPAALPD